MFDNYMKISQLN